MTLEYYIPRSTIYMWNQTAALKRMETGNEKANNKELKYSYTL